MIAPEEQERLLWIDFDRAQTFDESSVAAIDEPEIVVRVTDGRGYSNYFPTPPPSLFSYYL